MASPEVGELGELEVFDSISCLAACHAASGISKYQSSCDMPPSPPADESSECASPLAENRSLSPSDSRKRSIGTAASVSDEGVLALLPKMKRMRLRPSLGQLRLQREAHYSNNLGPEVQLCVEPEQLRAVVVVMVCPGLNTGSNGINSGCRNLRQEAGHSCSEFVQLELSFPPQYPHRPPKLCQVYPSRCLPQFQYDSSCILLPRLSERCWSSAMGVADVVRDVLEGLGSRIVLPGITASIGNPGHFPPVPVPAPDNRFDAHQSLSSIPASEDVDMVS